MLILGSNLLKAVENDAASSVTLGRSYSCGVSNVGVVKFESCIMSDRESHISSGSTIDVAVTVATDATATTSGTIESVSSGSQAETLSVSGAYYGTSHSRNGVCSLLSSMTINSRLCACLQFTKPITTEEEADRYRDALIAIISQGCLTI